MRLCECPISTRPYIRLHQLRVTGQVQLCGGKGAGRFVNFGTNFVFYLKNKETYNIKLGQSLTGPALKNRRPPVRGEIG